MKYVLSETAELDIDEIFDFGNYKFGSEQAINYLIGMQNHFEALCKNPECLVFHSNLISFSTEFWILISV